jgi:putative peptidoglycan lipid II flippase
MLKLIKKLRGQNSVSGATKILIASLLLSNILGMVRDHFLAQKIPTSTLDTYYAAFRLPDLIFNVLILGAISAAFIPVFTGLLAQRQEALAFRTVNKLMSAGLMVMILLLVVLLFLLPWLITYLVPEFSADKQELTLRMARLFLLSPLFFSISYLLTGVLNSFKHFVVTSLAPLIYNLSIITSTLLLADKIGVMAAAYGVVTGVVLHMLVQLPSVIKRGWEPKFSLDFKDKYIRKIVRLMIPRSIGLGAMQILLIIYTVIASGLGAGAVAVFNLADNIQTMPIVVFGTSVASAIFPHLSESFFLKNKKNFCMLLENAILMVMFFLIPMSIGVILLRAQIVRLILGSGHFGWAETRLAAATLGVFALALFFSGLVPLLAKTFYAREDTRTPMYISIVSAIVCLVAGWSLSRVFGVVGLAGGVSIGAFINAVLLLTLLLRTKIGLNLKKLGINLIKIIIASLLMVIFVQSTKYIYGSWSDLNRFIEVLGQLVLATAIGIVSFLAFTKVMGVDQFRLKGWENIILRQADYEAEGKR